MTKRANGDGTIGQYGNRWIARITLPDGRRQAFYGRTREDAKSQMDAALVDLRRGKPLPDRDLRLSEYLEDWLEDCVKPSVRPRTYDSYEQTVRCHINPALGKRRLSRLAPAQVQNLLNDKLAAGLSPTTVRYIRSVLRLALAQALRWDYVARNVAELTTPPRGERREMRVLSPQEALAFAEALRGSRLEAICLLAATSGLRQGELLGLHWSDVDLAAGTLAVRAQLQRLDKEYRLVEVKTSHSRRTIPIPAFAVAALRQHHTRQLEDRLAAGPDWQEHGLIFPSQVGTPMDAKNLSHRFRQFADGAGFQGLRFHDLRHSFASLLLAKGVAPRVIMEMMGHTLISTTMDTYTQVMPELLRDAADKMDEVFGQK